MEYIQLTVPERFREGGSWFSIPEQDYGTSEKSGDKLCIPIQRTGDLGEEDEVILKVTDISAKHDVNYTAELYQDDAEPDIFLVDASLVELIRNADGQVEYEPVADENALGEIIDAAGGAELVDENGNVVATVTATRLDENGEPVREPGEGEPAREGEPAEDGDNADFRMTHSASDLEGPLSPTEQLRAARDAFTGTVSDRQELAGGSRW